ncbi:MAG: beta-ketoacyl synthase N-terminal-like domain-containing protein, partial [Methylovulum sp.]|nr:beta-ketoacyl synthase N-terminal-like domain-containing protein [Methylovulum sp.]
MNAHEWVTVYGDPLPSGLVGLEVPIKVVATALPAEQKAGLETLMLKLLAALLQSLDLLADASATSLHIRYPLLPPFYQAWFTESLRLLAAHPDWIKGDLDLPTLWGQWEQVKVGLQDHADYKTQLFLVTTCLRALPDILTGRCKATEVLFPNSSMVLVEGIYKGNAVADMFNTVLGDTVLAYCRQRLAQDPHTTVRILEIGAGTGGTTAGLIARLQPLRQHIEEYCYTDVSKAFLHHADSHYAPAAPYLKTCLFDVSKPLAGQGILPDHYDLVIASNVLHATQSIRTAVRNAKAALRNRGCLLMNELSTNALAAHLTFGLLEGWWLYQDGALRIPGCPGLSTQTWAELLEEEGFSNTYFPAQAVHHFGQQIIIAESDGVVRQLVATAPTAQTATPLPPVIAPKPAAYSIPADQRQLRAQAVAYLKQLLAATLKIPAEAIDSAQAMEVYGLDSILVVQLANTLHKQFTGITSTLFFEVQTLDALADHLLKTQAAAFIPLAERGQNPPAAQASVSVKPMASSHYGLKKSPRLGQPTPPCHQPNPGHFPVAIIGLSGRYPQAADIYAFWDNLITGKNCISEIPAERWDWQVYFTEEKGKLGHHYSKWGGFLDDVDKFDPLFFQISPRDAERIDPQERLFLETAYASIEDAGYTPASLCPSRKIGVFVGVMNSLYTGQASHWSVANRVSYTLNCQGPSLAVDTACSSSLTAIHLALESLYTGSSECAIVGGVNLILDPKHYGLLSEMTMISAGSQCRPFAADADGFVDGEGVGAVLLKPLAQAIADHDHIYGVIKASMVNAGGKTNGYTVPNPLAQARLISETLQKAGVSPDAVSYLEAHGTGTVLGDPIEVSALSQAFAASPTNPKNRQYCALGSVKSNIGHCESAAGIAGLTKVLLQMQHRQLAPSLHATILNPHINFADTPFAVQQQPAAWQRPVRVSVGVSQELPRLAGLSSFGAGGANAHLLVEEYIGPARQSRPDNPIALLVLSAKTPERLQAVARNLLVYVQLGQANLDLLDVAYTLQIGRVACSERLAFVAASLD